MHYHRRQANAYNVPSTASTAIKTTTASPAQPIPSMSAECALDALQAAIPARMSPVAPSAVVDTSWLLLYAAPALRDAVLALSAPASSARAA